jgi:hypothetical protein
MMYSSLQGCIVVAILFVSFCSADALSLDSRVREQDTHRLLRGEALQEKPLHGARLAVVAAHHNENLAWLDTFAQKCADCHVYVYTSSQKHASQSFQHGTIREVPNVGREWGKYLRFITDEYSAMEHANATVMFMHAHQYSNGPDDDDRGDVVSMLSHWPAIAANHILFLHGYDTSTSIGAHEGPVDYGQAMLTLWPQLFSELGPVPEVNRTPGEKACLELYSISSAEFSVPTRQIVHRSRQFYQHLEQWLMERRPNVLPANPSSHIPGVGFEDMSFDYVAGSILELMAYRIFQGVEPLDERKSGMDMLVSPQLLQQPLITHVHV